MIMATDKNAAIPILLASGNPAKQEALRQLLAGLPLSSITPAELGLAALDPPETGGERIIVG